MIVTVSENLTRDKDIEIQFPIYSSYYDFVGTTEWMKVARIDEDGTVYEITITHRSNSDFPEFEFQVSKVDLRTNVLYFLEKVHDLSEQDFWRVVGECREYLNMFPSMPIVCA